MKKNISMLKSSISRLSNERFLISRAEVHFPEKSSQAKHEENSKFNKSLVLFFLAFSAIIILRNAWVGDDSYIGFRTVYNFTNGYGLTFNINERVQSFTNPLWILLMSAFYYFTGEAYYTSIFLSLSISLILLYIVSTKIAGKHSLPFLTFGLVLSSKAFIDYSTSGLENPLGHLLLVLFVYVYITETRIEKRLFFLSFYAALAGVNRLDNILLYIAPLFIEFVKYFSARRVLIMGAGFSPLIAWEIFSIIYYGFPFPNTYYTKLNTDIQSAEYINQGFRYLINSISYDPVTLLTIGATVVLVLEYCYRNKKYFLLPFLVSILLYLLYTVKVGGDFMSGRFLTYPFLLSVIILSQLEMEKKIQLSIAGLSLFLSVFSPYSALTSGHDYRRSEWHKTHEIVANEGIADERAWYYPQTGLLQERRFLDILNYERTLDTVQIHGDSIVRFEQSDITLGFNGYSFGPNVYLFHEMALSDVLLARLPMDKTRGIYWRIGHIWRRIPEGYIETLQTGKNVLYDENLSRYYDKVVKIIRGNIFTWDRFVTIYEMNTGKYDNLIDKKFYSSWSAPIGQTIWLKGTNNSYVSGENGDSPISCGKSSIGAAEKFLIVDVGYGKIALQSLGKYLSTENGADLMHCNRTSVGEWESFEWVVNPDNTISLRGSNKKYVAFENGSMNMTCNKPASDRAKFNYGVISINKN